MFLIKSLSKSKSESSNLKREKSGKYTTQLYFPVLPVVFELDSSHPKYFRKVNVKKKTMDTHKKRKNSCKVNEIFPQPNISN